MKVRPGRYERQFQLIPNIAILWYHGLYVIVEWGKWYVEFELKKDEETH